jgi:tetratricopeptide (TPR) repeat protein
VSEIQIIMVLVTLFLVYKVYERIQNLDPDAPKNTPHRNPALNQGPTAEELAQKADIAFEYGDTEKAQTLLEDADKIRPDDAEITGKLAFMLAQNSHESQAIETYRHAIALDKQNDQYHTALASLYRKKGMAQEAKNHYETALEIDPDYEITYYNYGNLPQDMGEQEKAREMYEKAVALNPDFAEAKAELERLSA